MPERTLTVRIIGDDRSLQQAFKRSEKAGRGFQVGVEGLGAAAARSILPAAAAAVSVGAAFRIAGQSIDEASAVNEEVAKSGEIFGESAGEVIAWSETMARSFGISKRAALEATGIFGNLFAVVGIGPKEASRLSRSLVELAADMASFNNASPEDVLLAIRSGLVGEAEPLRRYGVLLSEARVQQVALAETGKRSVAALTNQEKAQARYAIILRDTIKAQGDAERTSDSLANQQRELSAQWDNLQAQLGNALIPALTDFVTSLNDAIAAASALVGWVGKLADIDAIRIPVEVAFTLTLAGQSTGGLRDLVTGIKDAIGDSLESALSAGMEPIENLEGLFAGEPGRWTFFPSSPDDESPGSIAEGAADKADKDAKKAAAAALEADRAKRKTAKAFAELEKGLGLKLSKAGITQSTDDDLAVLREWERAILRRIQAEGKTFVLVEKLTDVRLRIASVVAGQASDARQAIVDAFAEALDALELRLDIAKSTRGFADDLRALRALEAQILKQIAAEGRTTELLRRLFQNRQEQAQTVNDARNAAQFEALGLTAEGDRPTPGRGSLLKRAQTLQDQIKGTVLDTPKTRRDLARIVRLLRNTTKAVGRDVRQAILDMLNDISSALEGDGGGKAGPMTKFAKRGIEGLVKGLGLTEEQTKEIRQRFAQFNRFDTSPGRPGGKTITTSGPPTGRPGPRGDERWTINVWIDGQKVESTVTRRQQKKRGRNAPQRRGSRAGR